MLAERVQLPCRLSVARFLTATGWSSVYVDVPTPTRTRLPTPSVVTLPSPPLGFQMISFPPLSACTVPALEKVEAAMLIVRPATSELIRPLLVKFLAPVKTHPVPP